MTNFDLNEYIRNNRKDDFCYPLTKHLQCLDGFSMSVQANGATYSKPRNNVGPWSAVEVGFPSAVPELIMEYAENPEDPTETVYAYVPVELVEELIGLHGGVINDE